MKARLGILSTIMVAVPAALAGALLVATCTTGGGQTLTDGGLPRLEAGGDALAATPQECKTWKIVFFQPTGQSADCKGPFSSFSSLCDPAALTLPDGWEPVIQTLTGYLMFKKCAAYK